MRIVRVLLSAPCAAAAAVLVAACADPGAPVTPDIVIVAGAVAQGSAGFSPNPLVKSVAVSARVTWLNDDVVTGSYGTATGTTHRLVSDEGLFDAGNVAPHQAYSFTFAGPGTYHYHCLNHPAMVGTITVVP